MYKLNLEGAEIEDLRYILNKKCAGVPSLDP